MSKQMIIGLAISVAVSIFGWLLFRPVCMPITEEALKDLPTPLEQRIDERGMIYRFFQIKNGQWYQCKSAIEREFFF